MDKNVQTDLFPWILGALLVAVAVPAVLAFTKPVEQPIPVIAVTMNSPRPAPLAATPVQAPAAAPVPDATPVVPATAAQVARPELPAGQVWQCVVNGQRVFSDTACGAGATIRQLNDVNGMQPTPIARGPGYPTYAQYPGYAPPPAYYAPPDPDGGASSDVYISNQVAVIDGRRRREHVPAPRPHAHMAARGHR